MTRFLLPKSPTERQRFLFHPLVGGNQEINDIIKCLRLGRCVRFVGPRYHHKSKIMRMACKAIAALNGFVGLYISLYDAPVFSPNTIFTAVRDLTRAKAKYALRPIPKAVVSNEADLTRFLIGLPDQQGANVVLFVDDLEEATPDALQALLRSLRAAYETTSTGLRFLAVVCASHSLARVALGPTSPFENISQEVFVRDLDPIQTAELSRMLLEKRFLRQDREALKLIHDRTGGDRCLVSEICKGCYDLYRPSLKRRLTRTTVTEAAGHLIQNAMQHYSLAEGLQYLERDPDLLETILILIEKEAIHISKTSFDPSEKPDPLTMSGFVVQKQGYYYLKSDLHKELLRHHFSRGRISRLFAAAGRWHRALDYLAPDTDRRIKQEADRDQIVLASVNAMYSADSKREAFRFLIYGLETAYPQLKFDIYDFVPDLGLLQPVYPPALKKPIAVQSRQRPEARALTMMHDYDFDSGANHHLHLLLPLRAANDDMQGLIIVKNLLTHRNRRSKQEIIAKFISDLRHAARALSNRQQYEQLHHQAEQRANDLGHLLELTRALMSEQITYKDLLRRTLESAVKALERQAQAGSIYVYDRRTDRVKLEASVQHPEGYREKAQFKPGVGLAGQVYKNGYSHIVSDAKTDKYYKQLEVENAPIVRSAIAVPLIGKYGPLGVLCLDSFSRENAFDQESERLLNLFASQVALWLENLHLSEIVRDLNSVGVELRDLWSSNSISFFEKLATHLIRNFELSGCAIGLRSTGDNISFVVREGMASLPEGLKTAELQRLIGKTRSPITILNRRDEAWQADVEKNVSTLVAVSLQGEYSNHGVLLLASVGEFNPSSEEQKLLESFASQLTIALESARRINFEIDYQDDSHDHIRAAIDNVHKFEEIAASKDVLTHQVYDLLGALFYNAEAALVKQPQQGLSGSAVLKVRPTYKQGGVGQTVIVKIGRDDKVRIEATKYLDYVPTYLGHQHAAQLSAQYTRHLGALLYTLVESGHEEPLTLSKYYQEHSANQVITRLQQLFRETCNRWYTATRSQLKLESLRDLYFAAFGLENDPQRLEREAGEVWPGLDAGVERIDRGRSLGELPNPFHWIRSDSLFMEVNRCVTHGDLNANNIIVDESNKFWLIDFYRTGESHILRDLVVLETDLKFRLGAGLTLDEFLTVEESLLHKRKYATLPSDLSPDARKLAKVVSALRTEAGRLLGTTPKAARRVQLGSLLMGTLNVLRLRHFKERPELQPQRERVLLSAALICRELAELG